MNLNLILYGTRENPHKTSHNTNESPTNEHLNLHGSITSSLFNLSNVDQRNKKAKQFIASNPTTKQIFNQSYFTQLNPIYPSNKQNHVIDSKNVKSTKLITSTSSSPYLIVAGGSGTDIEHDNIDEEDDYDDDEDLDESNYTNDSNSDDDQSGNSESSLNIPSKSILSENQISQSRSSLEYLTTSSALRQRFNKTAIAIVFLFQFILFMR